MPPPSFTINPIYTNGAAFDGERSTPFPHLCLDNFLSSSSNNTLLREELLSKAEWHRKSNDLYSLSQTDDLAHFTSPTTTPLLHSFQYFLKGEVRDWLQKESGMELNEKVAVTGSRYSYTDHLLPHDDRLEGRAFAFVYYLSPNWKGEEQGGQLHLYSSDSKLNHPTAIAHSITPKEGSFVLFRVGQNSWHSVGEMVAAGNNNHRLSLNGWFHSDGAVMAKEPEREPPMERSVPSMDVQLEEVERWISEEYVQAGNLPRIKRIFSQKSELSLNNFLSHDTYQLALKALKEEGMFVQQGPPNKRNLFRLEESRVGRTSSLGTLLRIFRSQAMALLLSQWTGLKLHHQSNSLEEEEEDGPCEEKKARLNADLPSTSTAHHHDSAQSSDQVSMVSSLQRFSHGCYSMADDQLAADASNNGYCLDVMLFLGGGGGGGGGEWDADKGGFISYFAKEEESEILRVVPCSNTLAIVFREPEVLNFTKYVNVKAGAEHFFILNCSFFGTMGEEESEEDSDEEAEDEEEDYLSDEQEEGENGQ